ncbi:DUF4041 domain-containing protein [Clavibacter michiganensis]|uniref:DUF4041 domain-containing protein n=1 Tax=Clavibacter michiganensis TaxID=28447 RepID=UPI000B8ECE0A|nr:DUF4041 domain-containing protein [Clavibacter michiganensis]OQJ61231.1 ATPase [Clavibacter michiganensis subsp. insidiosus]RMC83614.1 DUF4041 domain-containing protein [Clavibacter michiganensis subsp. insidiosus]
MSAAAGWYDDQDPRFVRWWDGERWTEHVQPKPEVTQTEQEPVPVAPAAAPVDRLSKREARERAAAAEAHIAQLEDLIRRHGMREFTEVDDYRAHAASEAESARRTGADAATALVAAAREERDRILAGAGAERLRAEAEAAATRDRAEAGARAARIRAEAELQAVDEAVHERIETRRAVDAELATARAELVDVTATAELQGVGLFDYDHPAESSAELASRLEALRYTIKNAVRDKRAVTATSGFTFNGSEAQGRRFVSDMSKVLLRAYNAEAENAVKATRAGSLHVAQNRLTRAAEQIAKSGTMIDLRIEDGYHELRLEELQLASAHLRVLQAEKEMERERRAELREQAKATAELQAERDRLDKERAHYAATLAALETNGDVEGAARMRDRIDDVDRALVDVDYRAANVRAGYVYVISNVGAFGERMVKIGMTRRLEPMDRVVELGDASVPFRFDVHALFFADDAVGVEAMLHRTFAEHRVNRINLRREFFYVTPDEVLDALKAHAVEIVEFALHPAAEEYRASRALDGAEPVPAS